MPTVASLIDDALDAFVGRSFDPRLIRGQPIDTGDLAVRARGIAAKLNAVRSGKPKEPVVLWTTGFSALTKRGPWVYISKALAERLSDDALAFVLAHEMAHHDLGHLTLSLVAASYMGQSQRMELHADAEALRISVAAGFSMEGGLETFAPTLWQNEPEPEPSELEAAFDRFRRSHPPTAVRLRHLRTEMSRQALHPRT